MAPALALLRMQEVHSAIVTCERCERLRAYCKTIGETRRRAYRDQEYWAKPVPGFGDIQARILILGLAPGAHGGNRTGRQFTGDGSGNFMYPILYSLGLASQPNASHSGDGLQLRHSYITSVVRCAPPADKPTVHEIFNCSSHLSAELASLRHLKVVVCLGKIAFDGYLNHLLETGQISSKRDLKFGHGVEYEMPREIRLLASYHPSLRNTLTGKLDSAMFAQVFVRARELAGIRN